MTRSDQTDLDALFSAARAEQVDPSDALMARVLADAEALQPQPQSLAAPARSDRWAQFMDLIGGWPALSGVAAAGMAGLWIGFAPPAGLDAIADGMLGIETSVSLLGDFEGIWGEVTDG